jgi:signal peptidase I
LLLLKFVFFVGFVPTASMEPAIHEGSFIFGVRLFAELERGDAIVFGHSGKLLAKRIAGLPDDVVEVDGKTLAVPAGYCYVLGDNADTSWDSRLWDEPFVPLDDVVVKIIISPQNHCENPL